MYPHTFLCVGPCLFAGTRCQCSRCVNVCVSGWEHESMCVWQLLSVAFLQGGIKTGGLFTPGSSFRVKQPCLSVIQIGGFTTQSHLRTHKHAGAALRARTHSSHSHLLVCIWVCCCVGLLCASAGKSIRSVPLSIHPPACLQQIKLLQSQRGFWETSASLHTPPRMWNEKRQSGGLLRERDSNQ